MSKFIMKSALVLATGIGASAALLQLGVAADHLDPPGRTDPDSSGTDRTGDIADLYAWHTSDKLVTILTYDGPSMPAASQGLACDRDVLYGIHISNDDDLMAEFDIWFRYGLDDEGKCFVSMDGIPGVGGGALKGPAEKPINWMGVTGFAGLCDDPFFFDLQGFKETLAMGQIKMTDDRDGFAGQNASAFVVEMPLSAVSPTGEKLRIWATTSRIGG